MSKHTPGPWFVGYSKGTVVARGRDADGEWNRPLDVGSAADARLIAAAPELLEALQAAMPHLEAIARADNATYALARAALAKATGEGNQ